MPTADRVFEMLGVKSDETTAPLTHATDGTQQALRALVVAGPGDDRRQLEMWLGREDISPFTAISSETAIAALSSQPFAIVIGSVALGGPWDGLGLARWILTHQPATGIILLSDSFPWIAANSPLATVPVLIRPVVESILMEKVRSIVGGRQPR